MHFANREREDSGACPKEYVVLEDGEGKEAQGGEGTRSRSWMVSRAPSAEFPRMLCWLAGGRGCRCLYS